MDGGGGGGAPFLYHPLVPDRHSGVLGSQEGGSVHRWQHSAVVSYGSSSIGGGVEAGWRQDVSYTGMADVPSPQSLWIPVYDRCNPCQWI